MKPRYLLITSQHSKETKIYAQELMLTKNTARASRFLMNSKNIFKTPALFGVWETNINIQHLRLVGFHIM
jgi:hypothetical protein